MEQVFQKYGIAGICVLLTLSVLVRVGEFLWNIRQKKETLTDSTIEKLTKAVESNTMENKNLQLRMAHLENGISEFPKFKTDIRRFYAAIKEISGEAWPKIRDEIIKDEFTL